MSYGLDSCNLLPRSALIALFSELSTKPEHIQREFFDSLNAFSAYDERAADVERKRHRRSEANRIEIPDCADPQRRERCLADPELFLKTYFPERYSRPFGKHHYRMIETIVDRAKHGGRQAIAAPRGCGKSELVKGLLAYLILAELVRFPIPIAATTKHAGRIFRDFQQKIKLSDLLYKDFPEVCHPVRDLDGAPQRAAKQHIDGVPTNICWLTTELSLARVPGSPYGGVKMIYFGLDAAFRGMNIEGARPDFILVDDPETRESARSPDQIANREEMLDQDIDGLKGQGAKFAVVVITTVQNHYCLSKRLVDRKVKNAWNGLVYKTVEQWPDRMDMWEEYCVKRKLAQENGDEYGKSAIEFYLANREEMHRGAEMLQDYFIPQFLDDGTQLTHSALQVVWNQIADTNMAAFRAEYQNDPEYDIDDEIETLTQGRVLQCLSGIPRGELPSDEVYTFLGIDIGKYKHHWVKTAWTKNAVGWIVDYGIVETYGLSKWSTQQAMELAIVQSLEQFAESAACTDNPPVLALVDSGDFTESIYAACRKLGKPFFPAKGASNRSAEFKIPQPSKHVIPFLQAYAKRQWDDQQREMFLYHLDTEYWKFWTHQRFLTDPFSDRKRIPGSLAIFDPEGGDVRQHAQFARHMVSERMDSVPVPDSENKKEWIVVDKRNNHWLDALGYSCAAAGCAGVRLVREMPAAPDQKPQPQAKAKRDPTYRPFLATQR